MLKMVQGLCADKGICKASVRFGVGVCLFWAEWPQVESMRSCIAVRNAGVSHRPLLDRKRLVEIFGRVGENDSVNLNSVLFLHIVGSLHWTTDHFAFGYLEFHRRISKEK
jgi:hypothetical protein